MKSLLVASILGAAAAFAYATVLLGRRRLLEAGLPRATAVLVPNPDIVTSTRDGETVIGLAGNDEGLALNALASRCWELTDGKRPIWKIAAQVAAAHGIGAAEALREVRSFSRSLKLSLLALERSEWDLVHLHRDGLFAGNAGAGIVETSRGEGLIVHAAACVSGADGVIRPWRGGVLERRRGAASMRRHRAEEEVLEAAAREFKRGWDLCSAGRLDEALASFGKCLRQAPRWANAIYQTGYVLLRLGRYEEAREKLEEVERLSPGFYMVREYLDQARRLAAGDLSHEAFLLFDKANAAGLRDPDATIQLARRAIELSPEFPSARLILAKAYERKRLLHMALEELTQTIQMNPDKATLCHALLSRGSIFMAQGLTERAIREWTQVIELDGSATATRSALASLASSRSVH